MKDNDDCNSSLEEDARRRRERLLQLRSKATNEANNSSDATKDVLPKPTFRSYNPTDESLKMNALPKAVPDSINKQTDDNEMADALIEEVDLTSLAPRKIDWDLKRNLNKKLDKLERRTQRAIAQLIRERLLTNKDATDNLLEATQALDNMKKAEVEDDE